MSWPRKNLPFSFAFPIIPSGTRRDHPSIGPAQANTPSVFCSTSTIWNRPGRAISIRSFAKRDCSSRAILFMSRSCGLSLSIFVRTLDREARNYRMLTSCLGFIITCASMSLTDSPSPSLEILNPIPPKSSQSASIISVTDHRRRVFFFPMEHCNTYFVRRTLCFRAVKHSRSG